jgi:thiol-disulfide isomerase/thioredoxin
VHKPKNNRTLLISLGALLLLVASYTGLQHWFADLDQRFVQYEKYEIAPSFNLELQKHVEPASLAGKKMVALHDLSGKAVLVHFWASWCIPCREERPMLQELVNQHHDGSLAIIGIASYETEASLQNSGLLPETPFTVLLDEEGDVAHAYKVRAIPQSVLIDAQGRIRYRVKGALTLNEIGAIEAVLINMRREEKQTTAGNP